MKHSGRLLLQDSHFATAARSHLCCADCSRASHAAEEPESTLPPGVAAGVAASVVVDWEALPPRSPQPPPRRPLSPGRRGALNDRGSRAQRSSSDAKASHSLRTSPEAAPAPVRYNVAEHLYTSRSLLKEEKSVRCQSRAPSRGTDLSLRSWYGSPDRLHGHTRRKADRKVEEYGSRLGQ